MFIYDLMLKMIIVVYIITLIFLNLNIFLFLFEFFVCGTFVWKKNNVIFIYYICIKYFKVLYSSVNLIKDRVNLLYIYMNNDSLINS